MKFVCKENALSLKEVAYWKKIFNERYTSKVYARNIEKIYESMVK